MAMAAQRRLRRRMRQAIVSICWSSSGAAPTVGVAAIDGRRRLERRRGQRCRAAPRYLLVQNTPSNVAANAYRTAASMSVATEFDPDTGAVYNAEHAWRGSYLSGPIGPDPWGTRYSVNVEFLARATWCRAVRQRERRVRDFGGRRSRRRHTLRCRWCNHGQRRSDLRRVRRQRDDPDCKRVWFGHVRRHRACRDDARTGASNSLVRMELDGDSTVALGLLYVNRQSQELVNRAGEVMRRAVNAVCRSSRPPSS